MNLERLHGWRSGDMSVTTRLRNLELQAHATMSKGRRHFNTANGVEYFEVGPGYSYLDVLICADGNNPTDKRVWTQEELNALEREGWQVLVVHWVNNWRSDKD